MKIKLISSLNHHISILPSQKKIITYEKLLKRIEQGILKTRRNRPLIYFSHEKSSILKRIERNLYSKLAIKEGNPSRIPSYILDEGARTKHREKAVGFYNQYFTKKKDDTGGNKCEQLLLF